MKETQESTKIGNAGPGCVDLNARQPGKNDKKKSKAKPPQNNTHRLLSWAIWRTCCCPGASDACLADDLLPPFATTRYGPNWRTLPPCGDTHMSNFFE